MVVAGAVGGSGRGSDIRCSRSGSAGCFWVLVKRRAVIVGGGSVSESGRGSGGGGNGVRRGRGSGGGVEVEVEVVVATTY